MMTSTDNNDNIKIINDTAKVPEGIGIAEDSGFASITGSVTTETQDEAVHDKLICNNDIKFGDIPVESDAELEKKKKNQARIEAKRQADAEYDSEKKEQTYKRLMHLVSKSKFYSKYIIDKMNTSDNTNKKKKAPKRKVENNKSDNSKPPLKRSKRVATKNKKYNLNEYISDDIRKKVNRKINLSDEEIEKKLNTESDEESDIESPTTTFIHPKYFDGELWEYQQEGVQWLKALYDNGVNGILADEMGLGKTIQVIALLCALIEKKQSGPYLIIVPLSTMPNWVMEFEKFAPTLPVFMLYGTQEEKSRVFNKINTKYSAGNNGFKTQPIILTTYETIFFEPKLRVHKWRYIIIDEGHRIKNPQCQLARILKSYKSMNRLLLTGTPLQNNLSELWSLLHFLLPDIFDDLDVFQSWFSAEELQNKEGTKRFLQQEKDKQVMSSLREILKPFMLRREKEDVNLNIPPKKEIIVYAPVTELQRELYAATLNRDYHTMTKVNSESLIIDDETGARPKRKCLSRNKYSTIYENPYEIIQSNPNDPKNTFNFDDSRDYKKQQLIETTNGKSIEKNSTTEQKVLESWKQYTNITDRNRDFLMHLTFQNRLSMYKLIINHPYLVHCPLDDAGLPSIDDDLINVSGKLLVLDAMLKKLHSRGHKVLLFSTMTMVLDVICDYLTLRPWNYVKLDGRTKMSDRKTFITEFNSDPNVFLFLISTRAGGVGLNLAAADTVIIYDSDWNPQADLQAMARCHRIGQTRPVVVYRLCTKGTIDEAIIRRAEAKRKLEKLVISKDFSFNINNADTILELKRLLESSECEVVTSKREVFTDAELDKILDRSDLWEAHQKTTSRKVGSINRKNK
ncbi:hypothetical protein PV326_009030 [Microctonus aethiopoides]|uniref:Lymphoid-specific helicase n=1 Tax=Microctonus aethiopoides TaxID=144406 RepID=A0AA39F985_9HYME|nr:hypothetical protein PV326_009030 [Microctonus aethiopoides]KAK0165287.1 hypothetical protein PV328_003815 [Microctonus aethiopoides]